MEIIAAEHIVPANTVLAVRIAGANSWLWQRAAHGNLGGIDSGLDLHGYPATRHPQARAGMDRKSARDNESGI